MGGAAMEPNWQWQEARHNRPRSCDGERPGSCDGERPGAAGLDCWSQRRRTQRPGHTEMIGNQKEVEGRVHGGEIERPVVAALNCLYVAVGR